MQKFIDVSGLGKVAQGFDSIAKSAFSAFESISRVVPGLAAITSAGTVAGMVSLANATAQWANTLRINADHLGTTTDRLQQFQGATQLAGGNVDSLIGSMKSLYDNMAGAFTGTNAQAWMWFQKLGINIADANGQLRTTDQLLPEVLAKINQWPIAADRTKIAAALGGQALVDLNEQFRASGQTLDQWIANYNAKFPAMSADQLDSLRKWRLAYAETETAFDHLGKELGATLARDFEPYLRWVNAFVEKHEPELVRALEYIGVAVTLLGGVFSVQLGVKAVGAVAALTRSLVGLTAAETAVSAAAPSMIGAFLRALGLMGAGAALANQAMQPTGNNVVDDPRYKKGGTWQLMKDVWGWVTGGETNPAWKGPTAPKGGPQDTRGPRAGALGGTSTGVNLAQMKQLALNAGFSAEEAPIIAATLMHESSGNPNARNETSGAAGIAQVNPEAWGQDLANQSMGNPERSMQIARMIYLKQGFGAWRSYNSGAYQQYLDAAKAAKPEQYFGGRDNPVGAYGVPGAKMNLGGTGALGAPGTNLTTITTPSGKTATVNKAAAEAFTGFLADLEKTGYNINDLQGFGGVDRTKRGGSGLSEHAFGTAIDINPGRNPFRSDRTDLPANIHDMAAKWGLVWGGDWKDPKDPMHFQWGGSKPWLGAQGTPVQVTGGPPVSGSVDVTVTHKNPPPGASVTATATGDATVATPRVEQAQMTAP